MYEQVHDVQVEIDCSNYVLFRGQFVHQQVSVINNKSTEQKSSGSSKHQLYCVVVEKHLEANEMGKELYITSSFNYLKHLQL